MGCVQSLFNPSKSRSPSPDNAFETPQFETVPVTQQPKRSYNTSATGISVADNRVHSYEEYDEYDTDDEMAINCDDFERYTLDIDDDMHSVHYVESTALTRLAASSSSVAILGTTAKCRSAGTSSAIQGQQSSSPSPSVSSLPTKPRPPLIGSVSQPTLDSGYNNQTAAREIAAKTEKTVVASSNSKETQEQWLSEDQWTEHLAKKSGHRAARFLDEDTGPPPPSPSPFSKPSVQWPLKWPIVDSSTQRNLNHMPVGVIEVIDREPVDQRPPPLTKAQRFPGTQRVSRNQNIHLPVIHAMEMKSNSLGHEDLFKTMRVQPPSSDRHGFRSRTGTGSSTFDSSSRKPFHRQSNEMKSQFTDDEYYAATGWMSNMPVFAKCPPPKAKSLSSGESKLSHTTAEVGMADKQPSVQPVSALPYDKSDIDNSTKRAIRKDDEVSTIVPIALKCATTVSDAIDKPDSFKKPSDQNVEDNKPDVATTTQENNPVDEPNEEVQPELKAEKELENIKVKNENDVEEVLKDQKNAANNNNSNNSKDEEPKLETEYRLTMIHSVREAVNRICEQAVEKTAAIVRGIHKRSSNVTLTSSFKDRDLSEFTDNVSSAFSLPPLPQQYPLDSGLTGQESSWPPPPEELEEEKTIAPGFSFDLPDPPTGMDQMDSETDKLDISDEEMKSIGLPNDETDTESGDGGAENDRSGSEIDLVMKSAANGGSSDGSVQASMAVVQDNGADDRAATTIQAVYRGFRARKYVEAVNAAAVKIQAGFRGYRVRQSLKNTAPSTATTTTDDSECWSDDDQKSIVSVTYAPLKEYGCEPRGAGDGRDDDDSEDDGDEPSSSGSKGDSISVVSGDVGIGGGDGEGNGEGVELSGIGAYEYDEDDEDQLQTGDDEVFEPDDKNTGGGGSVGNLVTNPTTTLTESETPTEMSKLDDVAEAEELVQAAIKIQARVRGFAARKRLNDKKNEVADEKK